MMNYKTHIIGEKDDCYINIIFENLTTKRHIQSFNFNFLKDTFLINNIKKNDEGISVDLRRFSTIGQNFGPDKEINLTENYKNISNTRGFKQILRVTWSELVKRL